MGHRTAEHGRRILIVAPFGRDAASLCELCVQRGYETMSCTSLDDLARQLDDQTGVVILTEEALRDDNQLLDKALRGQPAWSDVPFVLLGGRRGDGRRPAERLRARLPDIVTNVIVLDRPLGSESLFSSISTAMRARQKQFDLRDRMAELRDGAIALAANERQLDAMINSIDQMIWASEPDGRTEFFNQRWYDFTGLERGEQLRPKDGLIHPDDEDDVRSAWGSALRSGEPFHAEYRLRDSVGDYRWVMGRATAARDATGQIDRWYGSCTDIQNIVDAREVLSRSRQQLEQMVDDRTVELERANDALRQSQKMEAVGQLTGGIAHDFNNMLTGIMGGLDIIKRRIAAGRYDDLDRFMDAANTSAQRAAALTSRLLSFSRRQTLDSRPVDINALIGGLHDLLKRTTTENIALKIELSDDLPAAAADSNQLESAVLNLAINARDAMPNGGTLTIRTRAVETPSADGHLDAGSYVAISVSDDGVGMPPEILGKVFEPFFTTKPIGEGTGLGLPMVYGFAKQSKGDIRIESGPGEGTTVEILLPVAGALPDKQGAASKPAISGRGETILVVEDDDPVRMMVKDAFEELGFSVIATHDPFEAVDILRSSQTLHLMVTDVGLPGMNGRELAEVALATRRTLPILFVTGYVENTAMRSDFVGTNMAMITKPFTVDGLGKRASELLRQ